MSPSSTGQPSRPFSSSTAWGCAAANLLLWPGLGTVLARRRVGLVQMGLSGGGFVMSLVGFVGLYGRWFTRLDFPGWRDPYMLNLLGGVGLVALTWFWSLGSSIAIIRQARQHQQFLPPRIQPDYLLMKSLGMSEITAALAGLPQWRLHGAALTRTYQFKDFVTAIAFVNEVAEAAENACHHPDLDIRWNKVTLTLMTHDAGGLTQKDFDLAAACDALAAQIQA